MVKIGEYNKLCVVKLVDFGVYLDGGNGLEILLPSRYIAAPIQKGDEINVFIYTDSEDRLIATTERPIAQVGEFAYLQVQEVNRIGAFLDWGLPKNLLVPFREQRVTMKPGERYLVYLYVDDTTKRVVASAKIDKFLGNVLPIYKIGDKVSALVVSKNEIGYRVIIDNLHYGIIYFNEVFQEVVIGQKLFAYVKKVRDDGKIDLTLSDKAVTRITELAEVLYEYIVNNGGEVGVCDKSSSEEIKQIFSCSKKDFKKAIGLLYKQHRILITDNGLKLS